MQRICFWMIYSSYGVFVMYDAHPDPSHPLPRLSTARLCHWEPNLGILPSTPTASSP